MAPPRDADCIFCRIIAGEIPAAKVYEDDHVLAFLDVGPLSRGHTLVIPKGHWRTFDQVPAEVAGALGRVLPALSRAVTKATGIEAWNILQNNGRAAHQVVDHVHVHLIPKTSGAGLGIDWPAGELAQAEAGELAQTIAQAVDVY